MVKRVLIMTATVKPPINAAGVARLDPTLRLSDYQEALRFYVKFLGKEIDHILFVENSNSDLDPLHTIALQLGQGNRVTFLGFDGNNFPPKHGRCYGEAQILDHAMNSQYVQNCAPDTEFWKVTGRYKILNLRRMMMKRPKKADFYIDLRSHAKPPWADLRILSWTKRGYDAVLRGIAPEIREDLDGYRHGEHVAYEVISRRLDAADVNAARVWTMEPLIDGFRAYDNRNWSRGRQLAVFILRSLQRRALRRVLL